MYKTIRHGENSLQYTILPQNDDFRIEGKLTSAESSSSSSNNASGSGGSTGGAAGTKSRKTGSSGSGGGSKSPKSATRRRSFFAYLGLIFVCTVIVGAVLIPFLVSAECLPSPTEWFLKTKAALISGNSGAAMRKTAETTVGIGIGGANVGDGSGGGGGAANIGKTVRIINQNGIEKFILKVNKTTTMQTQEAAAGAGAGAGVLAKLNTTVNEQQPPPPPPPPSTQPVKSEQQQQLDMPQHQISEVRFEPVDQTLGLHADANDRQSRLWPAMPTAHVIIVTTLRSENDGQPMVVVTTPTTTTTTTPPLNTNSNTKTQALAGVNAGVLPAPRVPAYVNQSVMNQSSPLGGVAPPTITTRIIQVPLLKSAAKKPIIPPVLAKTNSQPTTVVGMNVGGPPAVPALQTPQAAAAAAAAAAAGGSSSNDELAVGIAQNHDEQIMNNLGVGIGGKRPDWMNAHWSYINPSTYFQDWTGRKAEDSVLLPALLGFALIGMILIITVCLVARNKRTIVSSVRKRNRNDIEEQGAEDNATLLTTTNLSDDE